IYSAGTWDSQSKQLAIATVASGRPALAIYNALSGHKEREISVAGVDQILNPTWAPDGHAIAFSGLSQGLSDLYVYDLMSSRLRRLTNDAYAELHPAWSPDSRRIAFATDRYSSDLETMRIGALRLAILDAATGTPEAVPAFHTGKQINPQWTPDGQALYFIGDPDGIANIYRVSLASGKTEVITAVG